MQITTGVIESAQKAIIYGPEGIGKSTIASMFPEPLFIDTEGSTKKLNVARLPAPTSWTMLLDDVKYVKANPHVCKTLVIDTADWAEILCANHICSKSNKEGIEDFGYGKGYVYLEEEFGRLLNLLIEVIDLGIHVVFTAHAQLKKHDQPDEMGSYDRWELKMEKKTAPLVKEWADIVLFANYKTHVINVDGQGAAKGKNKVQGGTKVMYTSHHSCWDAKNRHGLPEEVPFKYESIAHCFPVIQNETSKVSTPIQEKQNAPVQEAPKEDTTRKPDSLYGIVKPLADLMKANNVTSEEIQEAVSKKGYYPKGTPIANYDPAFISGVLVAAWPQVFKMILDGRSTPFKL